MDYKELRKKVNAELERPALIGLEPDPDKKIMDGLSSGSMMLNNALSGSPFIGYVWGRIIEIYGPEQSGKTTLALHAIREAQRIEETTKEHVPCLFIDAEHALDTYYAECLGIDLTALSISQPDCGEDALNEVEAAVKAGFKLIVVDSVAALTPRAEIDGEMGESHMGLQARLMSQAMRKLTAITKKSGATLIFINQIRLKIGVIFGNPEVTSGGNALKFYATYRIEIRSPRSGKKEGKSLMGYEDANVETGTLTNVKVVKNKVFPPHRKATFHVEYGKGIDKIKDTIAFLELAGAFKSPGKKKDGTAKSAVVKIPSKKKMYTVIGLAKVLSDPEVQKDVLDIIRGMEEK